MYNIEDYSTEKDAFRLDCLYQLTEVSPLVAIYVYVPMAGHSGVAASVLHY